MKLFPLTRPLFAALCGVSLAALPAVSQERTREDRPTTPPTDSPRPPRGEFRADDKPRGEARPGDTRRDDARGDNAPRGERGGARPDGQGRDNARPAEGQRGQFNPQELFRDLNEDQRAALRSFFEAGQGAGRDQVEKNMRLRHELTELVVGDKLNEDLIRDKIAEAAKAETEVTLARARAFALVREKLPKETVERLRAMIANMGPRPGGPMPGGRGEGESRRPGGDQPGRGGPDGQVKRPEGRDGDRRPADNVERKPRGEGDRAPQPEGDRKPRLDGDRGPRPDGDRGRNPDGGDKRPELPRRPPTDQ
ncbi:MAG: hypothetical protein EBS05_19190 [Proteobacteria bacterium]|nr:hypothetical protein [Pseudomonadota bacterium]